jgi:hypothetical protein
MLRTYHVRTPSREVGLLIKKILQFITIIHDFLELITIKIYNNDTQTQF